MKKEEYDVIIVGAGIGGLVSASYISKAGKKVLVLECSRHSGGCCASFEANGFQFDPFVHSLGSCRKGGRVSSFLSEFKLNGKLSIQRYNPSDIVISGEKQIRFWNTRKALLEELSANFPEEGIAIHNFLSFVSSSSEKVLLIRLQGLSLAELLDSYFKNSLLKSVLGVLILGNAGLPPSLVSAYFSVFVFRDFIFDGGYYVKGGIQEFANVIAENLNRMGADILFASEVSSVQNSDQIFDVTTVDGRSYRSQKVILNCSIYESNRILNTEREKIPCDIKPSLSAFTLYLGMDDKLAIDDNLLANVWYLPQPNLEKMYADISSGNFTSKNVYLLMYFSEFFRKKKNKTISIFVNAPYSEDLFGKNKDGQFINDILSKAEVVVPQLRKHIVFLKNFSPVGINKYIRSYMGATYGASPTVAQCYNRKVLQRLNSVPKLYFVGHWTTQGFGVPAVVDLARRKAGQILNEN
ncbi:MAG: NAD(P)/FAD-dependent oxidoreductase [Candidatus Omnitrophota bacterium]